MSARIILLVFALTAMFAIPTSSAAGADTRDFDAGYIISDSEFYDWDSMDARCRHSSTESTPTASPGLMEHHASRTTWRTLLILLREAAAWPTRAETVGSLQR